MFYTNANPQQLDLLLLWLTVGGPHTNAESYALLRFQQYNGHSTLNYSLCKINMSLAAQTGSERPAGKVGKMSKRWWGGGGGGGYWGELPPSQPQPLLNSGNIISWLSSQGPEAGLLWQSDSDSCCSPMISFPFISCWHFSSADWMILEKPWYFKEI